MEIYEESIEKEGLFFMPLHPFFNCALYEESIEFTL